MYFLSFIFIYHPAKLNRTFEFFIALIVLQHSTYSYIYVEERKIVKQYIRVNYNGGGVDKMFEVYLNIIKNAKVLCIYMRK